MTKALSTPEQADLLSADQSGTLTEQPIKQPKFDTTETPVKVDLVERRENLIESLRLLGKVSRSYGFEQGSDPDNPRSRDGLQRRYRGELEQRVEASRAGRDDSKEATGTGPGVMAREHFYPAFGYLAMLSGMSKEGAESMRDESFKEFKSYFLAQPHGRKRRNNYIKKLEDSE